MWQKAFHVVLVTFLVVFSAAMLVLLMAGLSAFMFSGASHTDTGFAYSGGLSIPVLKFIGTLVLLSSVLIISLVARRRRLR
jgi:hypothetical protein